MYKRRVNFKRQGSEPMTGTTETDKNDLEDHRVYSFEALGFSKEESGQLAAAKFVDRIGDKTYSFPLSWHKVKKALDAGCSKELALKIFT